jgi:uncharacterized damage-inducible protein DinB
MNHALDRIFLDCAVRKLQLLAGRIQTCLEGLSDEQIWARGSDNQNAIGNLVLHLCGNVRQWILSGVGGKPDKRERDREFSARGGVPVKELALRLRETVDEAIAVLSSVTAYRLAERIAVQKYDVTVLEAIFHVTEHFSMHTGQIIFATKMLTGEDLGFYRHLESRAAHGESTP